VFNHQREIVALKLTPGNAADTTPVPGLTKDLSGKLFATGCGFCRFWRGKNNARSKAST